ncbi:MAG: xanthine dehydrogenase family protein molybdopterin-binding subunit [Hyphomicrobiales bacterium]|nr:xanthine dehydrogenase family protein molybdopterin-binding subunit [Hyphomicrobiales bacterium]
MTKMDKTAHFSRRSMLKAGGALVVSVGTPIGLDAVLNIGEAFAQGAKPPLTPDQLSSYIAVNANGTVSAFFGKMDMGQGLFVAIGQMVAEELDVPFKTVTVIMGDTSNSVNQGGASGSTGIQYGGKQMRMAAAEARRVLVDMAAAKLGLPADQLTVTDAVVHAKSDPSKKASYAELIGGRYFNVQLEWNKQLGNLLYAPGKAKPKDPKDYKIVGKPIKREDIAPKVFCQEDFCTDIKVPGMVHGRMIRPAVAGAVPVKVDESSIKDIPGARIVWENGFLGVVADKEWDVIKAAGRLKVEWSNVAPPFPDQNALYDHIRKAPVRKREIGGKEAGNVDDAFRAAARVIEAEYEWPFQSHACMGPACALVEIKDGRVTCWTGTQKSHFVQNGLAATLDIPVDKVHVIWKVGPGSYGRSDADDAAMDAGVLAKAVGKPVRVQYTRDQGTGWDPKGPASIHRARAAIDANGNVIAYEFTSKGFSRIDVNTSGNKPLDTLAGQTRGIPLASGDGFGVPAESYEFANKRLAWETIPPLLERASPLRSSHLRDPVGPQIHFASESFMDEVAAGLNVDPIEFRLRHVKDPRDIALIKAVAEKSGWQSRPSPRKDQTGNKVTGRGIAYSQRNGTRCAIVAEVDIDRSTGSILARKFTVAHDCGQVINPDGLVHTIEGNIVQGVSRTLWEEVKFDTKNVTSVDWLTYPILDITETPQTIDVVIIDRPEVAPTGAGEPSMRPLSAAIANAIFDATGVRIRRVPFTPDRVKQAMS